MAIINSHRQALLDEPGVEMTMREALYPDTISHPINGNDDIILSVLLTAMLCQVPTEEDEEDDRCAKYHTNLQLTPPSLRNGNAKLFVMDALSDLNITDVCATFITDAILSTFTDIIATWSADKCTRIRCLQIVACASAYVCELPSILEEDPNSVDDIADIDFGDHEIRFGPASKESLEGLVKATSGESAVCTVCLDEAPVGSEVTRLPCSHCFHSNCIVRWLERSKFCPACRFELP